MAGAKAMQAFQLTEEYNGALFSWYFKGFKILRRYLTKHNPRIDLEGLDFEEVDKEMEGDEVVEAAIAKGNIPDAKGDALELVIRDDALAA